MAAKRPKIGIFEKFNKQQAVKVKVSKGLRSKSLKLEKFEVGKDRSWKKSTLQKFEVGNVQRLLLM